ncbi:hypothetical protein GOBAR_DD03816 [Gossypium barbadense]|nr:hypothetical protein GOBAR_DD03816 [Gossypium barbadense]
MGSALYQKLITPTSVCAAVCTKGLRRVSDSNLLSDGDGGGRNPSARYKGQLVYGGDRMEACVMCEGITRMRSGSKGSPCMAAAAEGFQKP